MPCCRIPKGCFGGPHKDSRQVQSGLQGLAVTLRLINNDGLSRIRRFFQPFLSSPLSPAPFVRLSALPISNLRLAGIYERLDSYASVVCFAGEIQCVPVHSYIFARKRKLFLHALFSIGPLGVIDSRYARIYDTRQSFKQRSQPFSRIQLQSDL